MCETAAAVPQEETLRAFRQTEPDTANVRCPVFFGNAHAPSVCAMHRLFRSSSFFMGRGLPALEPQPPLQSIRNSSSHHALHQRKQGVQQRLMGKIHHQRSPPHSRDQWNGSFQKIIPLRPQAGEKQACPEQKDPRQDGKIIRRMECGAGEPQHGRQKAVPPRSRSDAESLKP